MNYKGNINIQSGSVYQNVCPLNYVEMQRNICKNISIISYRDSAIDTYNSWCLNHTINIKRYKRREINIEKEEK